MPRIPQGVTPEQAAAELLKRRKARTDPAAFCEYVFPFKPAPHHKFILSALHDALNGGQDRILICSPPGSAKSTYASHVFPDYALGFRGTTKGPDGKVKKPEPFRIIGASHTDSLANVWSQRVRNTIKSDPYRLLFGVGLLSEAVERWETDAGGEYVAVGVGHGISGRRANLAIIDDPFPDSESAESQVYRDKVWRWYQDDLTQRLLPGAVVVLIQTRFHADDLAGRLLDAEANGGDVWRKIILPVYAEDDDPMARAKGELLWPDFFTAEEVARRQRNMSPRSFSALWMQRPVPESGDFFKREWIKYYDTAPDNLRVYMASDYAVTPDGGDFTVHIVGGVDEKGDLYLLDLWREQKAPDEWIDAAISLIGQWEPMVWIEESGPIWRAVNPFILRRLHETKNFQTRHQLASIADKTVRARAIQGRMSMGKVFFPKNAPWLSKFEIELLSFDAGKHDDQVDALALLGRMLHTMTPAKAPERTREQKLEDLREKLKAPAPPTLEQLFKDHSRRKRALRLY